MEPVAFIILSNLPGQNRLKNNKYFLGMGDNVIGRDPRCQIVLPAKYASLDYMANIRIAASLITIEGLHDNVVMVESNWGRRGRGRGGENYVALAANRHYIPKMEEYFYIGISRIKAIISTPPQHELANIGNIINRHLFKVGPGGVHHDFGRRDELEVEACEATLVDDDMWGKGEEKMEVEATIQLDDGAYACDPTIQLDAPGYEATLNLDEPINGVQPTIPLDQPQGYQATLQLDDGNFACEATIPLDDAPNYIQSTIPLDDAPQHIDATIPLDQGGAYGYEPTLNLDEPPPSKPPFSQEDLMNEIRRKNEEASKSQHPVQDDDFSMPDTIIDNGLKPQPEKPPIRQVSSNEEQDDEMEMGPTIKDEPSQSSNQHQRIKPSKTMVNPPKKQPQRLYNSDKPIVENSLQAFEPEKPIQDFDDLFGADPQPSASKSLEHRLSAPSLQHKKEEAQEVQKEAPLPSSLGLMQVSLFRNDEKRVSNQSSKNGRRKRRSKAEQESEEEHPDRIKVHFCGFKPTAPHKTFLMQQNMEFVKHPDDDYTLLLVKQPLRLTNRLLLALIAGKRIETEQWIFNKDNEFQSKLCGLNWKDIYAKKATHGTPLKGKGKFFVSKRLDDLLDGVIQVLGGTEVEELPTKNTKLTIVLRSDDVKDTEFYLENRQVKKWRFLKSEAIVDCVLSGNYSEDPKYVVNIPVA